MKIVGFLLLLTTLTGFVLLGYFLFKKDERKLPCDGCEGCRYIPFSEEAFVSDFYLDENDSLLQVDFSLKDKPRLSFSMKKPENLSNFRKKVSNDQLKDTTIYYQLHGSKIDAGGCQPYLIDSVSNITK